MKTIKLPPVEKPMSSLDGYGFIGIDTDPEPMLQQVLAGLKANIGNAPPLEVVATIPVRFHGTTPGYLLVTYDRSKDPRAQKRKTR